MRWRTDGEREGDSFDLRSINLCSTTEADFSFFSFSSFLFATIFFVLCRWLVGWLLLGRLRRFRLWWDWILRRPEMSVLDASENLIGRVTADECLLFSPFLFSFFLSLATLSPPIQQTNNRSINFIKDNTKQAADGHRGSTGAVRVEGSVCIYRKMMGGRRRRRQRLRRRGLCHWHIWRKKNSKWGVCVCVGREEESFVMEKWQ